MERDVIIIWYGKQMNSSLALTLSFIFMSCLLQLISSTIILVIHRVKGLLFALSFMISQLFRDKFRRSSLERLVQSSWLLECVSIVSCMRRCTRCARIRRMHRLKFELHFKSQSKKYHYTPYNGMSTMHLFYNT